MVSPAPETRDLLQHVGRYRVTTADALQRLFFADKTRDAAVKAANRLVDRGLLARVEIGPHRRTLYQLTRQGAAQTEFPASAAQPLRTQGLFEHYAVLLFCCHRNGDRQRLTLREFQDHFPEFSGANGISGAHQAYYTDYTNGTYRLGRATIDCQSDPARLARKCRDIARLTARTPSLCDLATEGLFTITVLTSEPEKATLLSDAIQRLRLKVATHVEPLPELLELL